MPTTALIDEMIPAKVVASMIANGATAETINEAVTEYGVELVLLAHYLAVEVNEGRMEVEFEDADWQNWGAANEELLRVLIVLDIYTGLDLTELI